MKIKKSVLLLAVCALGALAAHAGAEGNAPVKIGDTQYATIAEAVNAASGDAVITLTGDATVSETMTIEKGKNITLDLSSYTLTSNVTDANPEALSNALITNNGTLTIIAGENGKYSAPRADSCAFINNTGTLIIGRENDESPTIFNMACFGCIYNYGGEITVNSASFNAPSSKSAGCGIYNASGNTVIKSATFTGSMAFLNGYGKITVEKDTKILTGDPISSAGELEFNGCTVTQCQLQLYGGTATINGGYYGSNFLDKLTTLSGDATIKISSGTFGGDITHFLNSSDTYEIIDGKYVVNEPKELTILTGTAVTAVGSDGSEATGFITTISGGEVKKISWVVTSKGESKTTGEYAFNGVSGDGDVKIGLIVTELNDGNAKAVATVNGVAEK